MPDERQPWVAGNEGISRPQPPTPEFIQILDRMREQASEPAPPAKPAAAKPEASKKPQNPWPAKDAVAGPVTLLGLIASVVGAIMVIFTGPVFRNSEHAGPGHIGIGMGLLIFGLPALVAGGVAFVYDPPPKGRVRAVLLGTPLLLVMFVSLVATLAGIASVLVRWEDPADYTGRYGTSVTVTLPSRCEEDVRVLGAGARVGTADIVCDNSTWQLGGATHTGTVVIGDADINLPSGIAVPDSVEAYVLGDKGYSVRRVGLVENVALWGGVSLWWLPIGLAGCVLTYFGLNLLGARVKQP